MNNQDHPQNDSPTRQPETIAYQYRFDMLMFRRHSLSQFDYQENEKKEAYPKGEEKQFYAYFQHHWEKDIFKLCLHLIKEDLLPRLDAYEGLRHNLYEEAIGLASYGRKDVIPLIFQELPERPSYRRFVKMLLHILPLPEPLKDLNKKTEILDWLETHYDQLTWDEEKEVFYLKEEG